MHYVAPVYVWKTASVIKPEEKHIFAKKTATNYHLTELCIIIAL